LYGVKNGATFHGTFEIMRDHKEKSLVFVLGWKINWGMWRSRIL